MYKAATKNAAEIALDELDAKRGKQYPAVINSWRSKWDNLSVYFNYQEDMRKAIYTTNTAEAVHCQFCKLTKTESGFANENSLLNLLYACVLNASEKWTHPVRNLNMPLAQMAIHFEGRIENYLDL